MKTINDFNFKNKKALIRVDFNVPLDDNLHVTDNTRIEAAKPTIIKILEDGGSCILLSHLGRPEGKEKKYSLKNIADEVSKVIGIKVKWSADCIGEEAQNSVASLKNGEVLLLENLRFHPQEKNGDEAFAEQLAKLGDIYVNDAFGTAHRAHSSTAIIAKFFPKKKCFGNLLAKEIENINKVLKKPEKPVTAILGGAKVSSKIGIIKNIVGKTDNIIIGGGMSFTFIKALGGKIGNSLVENDKLQLALDILKLAEEKNTKIYLPTDAIIADKFANDANKQTVDIKNIPNGWMGLDVGEKTNAIFASVIANSKTILWNGPLGVFEMENFSKGTVKLGDAISEATKNGAFSLVGGGDSVAAVKQFGFENKVSYVSTGGGAMLECLEGKTLPGIEAMMN